MVRLEKVLFKVKSSNRVFDSMPAAARAALDATLNNVKGQFVSVKFFVPLLMRMKEWSDYLSASYYPTLSGVVLMARDIESILVKMKSRAALDPSLSHAFLYLQEFETAFKATISSASFEQVDYMRFAVLLDPRVVGFIAESPLWFMDPLVEVDGEVVHSGGFKSFVQEFESGWLAPSEAQRAPLVAPTLAARANAAANPFAAYATPATMYTAATARTATNAANQSPWEREVDSYFIWI